MRSPDRRETARHDRGIYRVAKKRHSAGDSEGCGVFRAEEERRAVRIRSGRKTGGERRTPRRKAVRGRKPGRYNAERHDATQRIMRRQYPACKNPSYGRSANGTEACRREKSRSNSMTARGCRGVGRKKELSGEFFQPSENCVSGKVPDEQYGQKGPSNKS